MDKPQRAALIRSIYLLKARGMAYVPSGKAMRPSEPIKEPKPISEPYEAGTVVGKRIEWIYRPDVRPRLIPKPDRRQKGQLALTRIAQQLPKRLPHVLFS